MFQDTRPAKQAPALKLPQSRIESFGAGNNPAGGFDVIKECGLTFSEPTTGRLQFERKKLAVMEQNQIGYAGAHTE